MDNRLFSRVSIPKADLTQSETNKSAIFDILMIDKLKIKTFIKMFLSMNRKIILLIFIFSGIYVFASVEREHSEDLRQNDAIKYLAWQLGSKVSLAAIGYEAGLPRTTALEMIDKVQATADYFDVQIPTLPYRSGSSAEFAATILRYLLDDFGGKIGEKLAEDYRDDVGYLFEIAIKSNILLLLYAPGEETSRTISDVIKHRAPRAGISYSVYGPLVRKVENGASYEEVKRAVVEFHDTVAESLYNN